MTSTAELCEKCESKRRWQLVHIVIAGKLLFYLLPFIAKIWGVEGVLTNCNGGAKWVSRASWCLRHALLARAINYNTWEIMRAFNWFFLLVLTPLTIWLLCGLLVFLFNCDEFGICFWNVWHPNNRFLIKLLFSGKMTVWGLNWKIVLRIP